MKYLLFMIIYINFFFIIYCDHFIATKEWKKIEDDQEVPPGLHYRINLETGYKEAKLLDESSETNTDESSKISELSIPLDSQLIDETPESSDLNKAKINIEEALRNIPSNSYEYSEAEIDKIKLKFKSYKEIKSDLNKLKMDIKTDNEIIKKLFDRYNNNITDETELNLNEKIIILEEMEYMVHQIDNALTFLDANGLEKIILPNLVNQTNTELRVRSLQLLGALMQNNPKAKITLFEKNIADHLIKILSNSKTTNEELSATVYAYGSLLRRFPYAQNQILSKSGLPVLFNLLTNDVKSSVTIETKLKIKIIILLNDFIKESKEIIDIDNNEEAEKPLKFEQYQFIDIENRMKNFNYCHLIENFIKTEKNEILYDFDLVEKLIGACQISKDLCYTEWSESPMMRHFLLVLKHRFEGIKESNDPDMILLYEGLIDGVNLLFDSLNFKEMEIYKDEL